MWCLRYFISRCFAIDGGLLWVFEKLGVQAIGYFSMRWAMGASFIVLFILKKTMGLSK
jgi:Amt family ammonium transporter